MQPPVVRDQARDIFFQLLRARYWSDADRDRIQIDPTSVLAASAVVDELAGRPYALYRELFAEAWDRYSNGPHAPRGPFEAVSVGAKLAAQGRPIQSEDPRAHELHEMMIEWARRWHLEAEWCLRLAFEALRHWCERDEAYEKRVWAPFFRTILSAPMTFEVPAWDGVEPLPSYGSGAQKLLRAQMDQYLAILKREAELNDWPTIVDRHSGAAYCWVVRSQTLGDGHYEISKGVGLPAGQRAPTRGNVDQAVSSLLKHLDLKPRPRPRGRPTGSKDRSRRIRGKK